MRSPDRGLKIVPVLSRHQLELVGHSAQLRKRARLHLLHRPTAVYLHCGFGNADIVGNLFAEAAAGDLNHDLALPGAERGETFLEGGQVLLVFTACTIAR